MNEENNKLIAEFMGWKWEVKDHFGINIMQSPEGKGAGIKGMKFHTSWDWLMPVAEKCLIGEAELEGEATQLITNIYDAMHNVSLIELHKAVVKFIEWYNENK